MRLLATLGLAAGLSVGLSSPAPAAETTPFPVCQDVYVGGDWFGVVCADPNHPRCLVYGGGYVWNLCVVNPV